MNFDDYTKQQQAAIIETGGVLVTASAGSGKTSVLVERVMDKILKKEIALDRLLIVTFTNAAAAEMRERIEKSLAKAQEEDPKNQLIAKQKQRLASAKICTVDSFCIELVRENFDLLGIMPDFAVADPSDVTALQNRAITEVLQPLYEGDSYEFRSLLQSMGDSYGDDKLKDCIRDIYNYVINMPFYLDWLKRWAEYYKTQKTFYTSVWDEVIISEVSSELKRINNIIENAFFTELIDDPQYETYKKTLEALHLKVNGLQKLCLEKNGAKLCEDLLKGEIFTSDRKQNPPARAIALAVKEYNELCKKINEWYDNTNISLDERYKFTADITRMLIELVVQFDKRFCEIMAEENALTFAQTEQLSLRLLCENNGKEIVPTKRGLDIADSFDEIIVDEYQDTNDLQDALVQALSNNGERLFVVGDAKQSIYEFRGTNPINFIKKQDNGKLQRIELLDNFRSCKNVCDFINDVFCDLMTAKNSNIEYKEQMLKTNDKTQNSAVCINLHSSKGIVADKVVENEAVLIAEFIKRELEASENATKYSDFTILLRSNKRMDIYVDVLQRCNVPAYCSRGDFLQKREIQLALSLLCAVDNPTKDAQLLAIMMSALFGFSADRIAVIRKKYPANSIWASVLCAEQQGEQDCVSFCAKMREYRRVTLVNGLVDFIVTLFNATSFEDIVRAMPDGNLRIKNIYALQNMAADYAKGDSEKGIAGFVERLSEMQDSQQIAPQSVNAVKVTTMHSSKGLEFPVCIIAGAANAFGGNSNKNFSIKSGLGVGCNAVGKTLAEKITSPVKTAIDIQNSNDGYAEELRLMYVFMTRAKNKLAIFGAYNDFNARLKEMSSVVKNNDNMPDVKRAASYMDCILQSALAKNSLAYEKLEAIAFGGMARLENVEYYMHTEIELPQTVNTEKKQAPSVEEVNTQYIKLCKNLEYEYPFEKETKTPSKLSVSELSHKGENGGYEYTKKPAFLSKNKLTPAQRGIATHLFMQFCDMDKAALSSAAELERLVEYQFISEQQANAVDMSAIDAFFRSELYRRIKNADHVYREIRFLTKIYPDGDELSEGTVLQGVADCVFEENGSLVIVDFKTDRVSNTEQLCDTYAQQLQLYASACQKTFDMPVKECIIYSFVLKEAVKV